MVQTESGKEITVKLPDGSMRTYPEGTTYRDIVQETGQDGGAQVLLARVDGRLRELFKKAEDGAEIAFVTVKEKEGASTYRRSLVMLMLKAFYHVVGDNSNIDRIGVHFAGS